MRVNFDSKALTDKRFKRLVLRAKLPRPHAYGACLMVWHECYSNLSPVLSRHDVDAFAEIDGFADAMIHAELAIDLGDGTVHICGVEDRIRYLLEQAERSRKGVEARQKRRSPTDQPVEPVEPVVDQGVNPGVDPTVNRSVQNEPMGQPIGQPNGQPFGQPSDLSDLSDSEKQTSTRVGLPVLMATTRAVTDVSERRRALGERLWKEHRDRHEALRVEFKSDAIKLSLHGYGREAIGRLLRERYPTLEDAESDCRAYIAKRESQARRLGHLRYFADGMWDPAEFAKGASMESNQAESGSPRVANRNEPWRPEPIRWGAK